MTDKIPAAAMEDGMEGRPKWRGSWRGEYYDIVLAGIELGGL